MKLVSVDTVRDALGFDDMTDISDAIDTALHAATSILEARLGTTFGRETLSDKFYVYEPGFVQGTLQLTTFLLRRGFLVNVTSVGYSDVPAGGSSVDILSQVQINSSMGLITNYEVPLDQVFVAVAYVSGFEVDETDAELYKPDQVPMWLQEAAKLQALMQLSKHPTLTQAQIEIDTKTVGMQLDNIVKRNLRYAPTAMLPL